MAKNRAEWASGHRQLKESGYQTAAEGNSFQWRCNQGIIAINLRAIWEMSDKNLRRGPYSVPHESDPISLGHRIGLIEVSKEDRNMTDNFENKVAVDGPVVNEGELGSSTFSPGQALPAGPLGLGQRDGGAQA